jgi:Xaa-Pro aminopeptidase
MSIADRVVVMPQREHDELNAEIAKLRVALKEQQRVTDFFAEPREQKRFHKLDTEIAKLRAALKIARKWMPTTIAAAYTIEGAEEVRIVDAALANEQEGK